MLLEVDAFRAGKRRLEAAGKQAGSIRCYETHVSLQ
jgi:hypothetical protein